MTLDTYAHVTTDLDGTDRLPVRPPAPPHEQLMCPCVSA
jgi:hypothetical protein